MADLTDVFRHICAKCGGPLDAVGYGPEPEEYVIGECTSGCGIAETKITRAQWLTEPPLTVGTTRDG